MAKQRDGRPPGPPNEEVRKDGRTRLKVIRGGATHGQIYPFDFCLACDGPVKVETGSNSEGHYKEQVSCVRGCPNLFAAYERYRETGEYFKRTDPPRGDPWR